jgi:hypothetical protein
MLRLAETSNERRDRYLKYAAEAETAAFRCGDSRIKDAYVNIATSWSTLAHEIHAPANDEH